MSAPEFSRPQAIDALPDGESAFDLEATENERRALAERFGLKELTSLTARVRVKPDAKRRMAKVRGELAAEAVQTCVVTLAPVDTRIETTFEQTFATTSWRERDPMVELDFSGDDADFPEPIDDGQIDLGETVAGQLSLELPAFPRAAGAAFEGLADAPDDEETETETTGPFAALAKLRRESENGR